MKKSLLAVLVLVILLAGCVTYYDSADENASDNSDDGKGLDVEKLLDQENVNEKEKDIEVGFEDKETEKVDAIITSDENEEDSEEVKKAVEKKFGPIGTTVFVEEGELVKIALIDKDPDGDDLTYTIGAPLNSDGEWRTEKGDEGEYLAKITASDGTNEVTKIVKIVVREKNLPPVLDLESVKDVKVRVGDTVELSPSATDGNDDDLNFVFTGWMKSSKKHVTESDLGDHEVNIIVSDGKLSDKTTITVTVVPSNEAPTLSVSDITVIEGETVVITPEFSDPEGDDLEVTLSGWMNETEYVTNFDDSGEYEVTVTVSDGEFDVSETLTVTVEDVNRAPEFNIVVG